MTDQLRCPSFDGVIQTGWFVHLLQCGLVCAFDELLLRAGNDLAFVQLSPALHFGPRTTSSAGGGSTFAGAAAHHVSALLVVTGSSPSAIAFVFIRLIVRIMSHG